MSWREERGSENKKRYRNTTTVESRIYIQRSNQGVKSMGSVIIDLSAIPFEGLKTSAAATV